MERTFFGVFSGCLAFLLAGGGILFLGWVLWWLWSRQYQEEEGTAVEIELDAAAGERGGGMPGGVEEEAISPVRGETLLPEPEEAEAALPEPEEEELLAQPEQQEGDIAPVPGVMVTEAQPPRSIPFAEIEGPDGADDLRVIEGIGPRIASVLRAGGVRTFRDLANADVREVAEILRAEDPRLLRLCKPDTWPEQAALAAAGDWEGLEALTNSLKGGRRV
jgi:predicted flap endonuclease-1-like 5' DNA nuclease